MEIRKILATAGLALAIGAFAPCAFAQGGAGVNQAPSEGQPGTQAPASAAPVGSGVSSYMSHEAPGDTSTENAPPTLGAATKQEQKANRMEVKLERDITAARARGANVAAAQHQKWLGSIALRKGDRSEAMREFAKAEHDLSSRQLSNYSAANNRLRAKETSQTPNAANMHSNTSATTSY
jgi:hypothetical protein